MQRGRVGSIMKLPHLAGVLCLYVPAVLLSGCQRPQTDPLQQPSPDVKVDQLPELGDHIGPLDQERIEVAPPKGWYVPPKSSRWIVRFTPSQQMRYPSIIVRAEDYAEIFNVSGANVERFAVQIAAAFEKNKSTSKQSMTITPIEIGRFVGISYRRRGKAPYDFKQIIVERLLLDTVAGGRRYTIELQTREGDLDTYRPQLLAVAAGIKFLQPNSRHPPSQPDTEPQADLIQEDGV